MKFKLERKLATGAAVLAGAAFAGGAYAATQDSNANPQQAFLADLSQRLHVTPAHLNSALQAAFFDRLAADVAAGRLTQAQADAIKQRVLRSGRVPFGMLRFVGPGGFALHAPRLFGPRLLGARHGLVRAAASYLGVAAPQLRKQLASGKSLYAIAHARGKSVSGLKAAMTAAVRSRLDRMVAGKLITSTREQQILSRLSTRLDREINRKGLFRRPPGAPDYPPPPLPPDSPGGPPVAPDYPQPPPPGPPGPAY